MDEKDLDIENRLTTVEITQENQERRLEDVEKRQDALDKIVTCVNTLSVNQKYMDGDIKEIKSDVKSLTGKSGKLWDSVVKTALGVLVGAFIAWLFSGAPGV